MSRIFLKNQEPMHFLIDSKGDMYQVSEELAREHATTHSKGTVTVSHIDAETNTIWFSTPMPDHVKAD